MRLTYPLLLLLVLLTGCQKDSYTIMDSDGTPPIVPAGPADTTISYLALGDSYTIGESVPSDQRWPNQLAAQLLVNHSVAVEPLEIVARTGWRTDNLSNALEAAEPGEDFDLVSLLIGVNDQYQGFSVDGYRGRFEALLKDAIRYGRGDTSNVFVVSIPDYAYTPFGNGDPSVTRELKEFNDAAREISGRYNIPFYSITEISERGLKEPDLVAGDGLHPSGKQYRLWVEEVLLTSVAARIKQPD